MNDLSFGCWFSIKLFLVVLGLILFIEFYTYGITINGEKYGGWGIPDDIRKTVLVNDTGIDKYTEVEFMEDRLMFRRHPYVPSYILYNKIQKAIVERELKAFRSKYKLKILFTNKEGRDAEETFESVRYHQFVLYKKVAKKINTLCGYDGDYLIEVRHDMPVEM